MATEPNLHPGAAIVEAIATLERAAGRLEELDRPDDAHRCTTAADRLHSVFVQYLSLNDEVEV
jgi:hypothetical protein